MWRLPRLLVGRDSLGGWAEDARGTWRIGGLGRRVAGSLGTPSCAAATLLRAMLGEQHKYPAASLTNSLGRVSEIRS
jgi:hypothetical protein